MPTEDSTPRPTLSIAQSLLWLRPNGVANTADKDSSQSTAIAAKQIELLSQEAASAHLEQAAQTSGSKFEDAVRNFLGEQLPALAPQLAWSVERGLAIDHFRQYRHLDEVARLVESDPSGLLRDALGTDYLVKPDVTVSRPDPPGEPVLHASVSCKWTIRSDRVQNARHEANVLIRHRRGRCPHIVVVTAEPLPSRLASIGQGTGEVDCTYHLALPELCAAVEEVGNAQQQRVLNELIANNRLADLNDLPAALLF